MSWGGGYPGGSLPWLHCCGGWYGGGYRGPTIINTGDINIGEHGEHRRSDECRQPHRPVDQSQHRQLPARTSITGARTVRATPTAGSARQNLKEARPATNLGERWSRFATEMSPATCRTTGKHARTASGNRITCRPKPVNAPRLRRRTFSPDTGSARAVRSAQRPGGAIGVPPRSPIALTSIVLTRLASAAPHVRCHDRRPCGHRCAALAGVDARPARRISCRYPRR